MKKTKPAWLNLSSKRAQLAMRFFTYGVMAVSTVILTALAIFYAMGFRLDQNNLTVEQGGRVQLRSAPEGATVLIDGQEISSHTPGRAYLSAGSHTVEMRLQGYLSWRRTIQLQPGQLLWLEYPRLIPAAVSTSSVHTFSGVHSALFSPDHRWAFVHPASDSPDFSLLDLSDETKPVSVTLTIPDSQLTRKDGALGTFTLLEWDLGSQAVLIRHDNGDVHELLRLERNRNVAAVNVSRLFGLAIGEAHFAGGNVNALHALTDGVLRRLDIGANSASATLVAGVRHFVVYGDNQIAFVAERELILGDTASRKTVVGMYQNGKEVVVRSYAPNTAVNIALSEYFRQHYLAIADSAGAVDILRNPAEKATATPVLAHFQLDRAAKWLSFSGNGRMLVAGADNVWVTHDLEVSQTYSAQLEGLAVAQPLRWLDDFYLWSDVGDRLRIVEFDGQNLRDIAPLQAGYVVGLSQDGKSLLSFGKADAGVSLQVSILEK